MAAAVIAETLPVPSVTTQPEWLFFSTANGDIPAPTVPEQTAAIVFDIDQDGTDDIVIGGRRGGEAVSWYKKIGDSWERYVIENATLPIEAGGDAFDIDGDGDLDFVMAGDFTSNEIWWWENPYPTFDPSATWTRHTIKNAGPNIHHNVAFGDYDGDGVAELAFWNQADFNGGTPESGVYLAEIPDDPKSGPWSYTRIFTGLGEGMAPADINGDGVTDLVIGGYWLEHTGGGNYAAHVIDAASPSTQVSAGDLNGDGFTDVVFNSGDTVGPLVWFENTGNPESSTGWIRHDLIDGVDHGHSVDVVDFDNDGNLDIFAGEMRLNGNNEDAKGWVLFGDGTGGFDITILSEGIGHHESTVGDLDGDGDVDILGKPFNWDVGRVDVWLNEFAGADETDEQLVEADWEAWGSTVIDAGRPWRALFLDPADINGDGFDDLVAGAWWFENPGENNQGWTRHTIGSPLNNVAEVYDFDGDGDFDVLGTGGKGPDPNGSFVWGQNDGQGNFTLYSNVDTGYGPFLQGVTTAQVTDDAPLQVFLSWQGGGDGTGGTGGIQALTVPDDPTSGQWSIREISSTSQGEGLDHGDIDGDGDIDLLLGHIWLRDEGDGNTWTPFRLHNPGPLGEPDRVHLVDMDNDGDLDALVGQGHDPEKRLSWFEQGDDPTAEWTEHRIANLPNGFAQSVDYADLDGDGDIDVIAGEHTTNGAEGGSMGVFVFENTDGVGESWTRHTVSIGEEHHDGTQFFDADNDGDLDIASHGWTHGRTLVYTNETGLLNRNQVTEEDEDSAEPPTPDSDTELDLPAEPQEPTEPLSNTGIFRAMITTDPFGSEASIWDDILPGWWA